MKSNLFKRRSPGFSLIELIVVTAIVGLVSASMIINHNLNKQRSNIRDAAEEIAGVLRKAQASALSGEKYQGNVPADYRVYFVRNANTFTVCVGSANCSSNIVETVKLPEGVTTTKLFVQQTELNTVPSSAGLSNSQVVFSVPYADVTLYRDGSAASSSQTKSHIILYDSSTNYYKIIVIDKVSGNVKVK